MEDRQHSTTIIDTNSLDNAIGTTTASSAMSGNTTEHNDAEDVAVSASCSTDGSIIGRIGMTEEEEAAAEAMASGTRNHQEG
jgi:hypothetical protein